MGQGDFMIVKRTLAMVILLGSILPLITGCLNESPPPANKSPRARFTASPTSGEAPLNVSFNASASSDSDGSITSYVWTFGDGGSSSGATAAHTYTSAGTYTARLIVTDNDGATDITTKTILVTPPPTVLPMGTISNDVTYSIIRDDVIPGTKRTVNIRLNRRVSENVLRSIALEVKSQDTREYEYIFILYYLPGMEVGAGAWATTHFDPELEVVFLGASPEELAVITNMPIDPSREVIGVWFWELPAEYSHRITIYYLNHTPYMEKNFLDGSGSTEELTEKASSRGRRFEVKDRSYGEYFLLDSQGNLHLGDEEGLFETLQKIK